MKGESDNPSFEKEKNVPSDTVISTTRSEEKKTRGEGEEERRNSEGREMGPRGGGGGGIRVKRCELCVRPARIHCESDEASLCWECDAKVHGANFLVARHSRCLLCRSCQSPTPWRAEGARLRPTFSVCERCAAATSSSAEGSGGGEGCGAGDEEEGAGEGGRRDREEDEEEEEEEDEEGENQVVPWSLTPPPAASSSSSSEGEEEPGRMGNGGRFLKRMRENAHLSVSQDDLACSSSLPSYLASSPAASPAAAAKDETISYVSAFRSSKDRKRPALRRPTPPAPCSMSASTATSIS